MQPVKAQQVKDSSIEPGAKSMFKIRISANIGPEWEQRINATSTIILFGGWSIGRQSDTYDNNGAHIISSPGIFAEYRNYYNLLKRVNKRKNTRNNAADFLFGRIENVFAVKNQNNFNLLLIQGWGIQRSIAKKIMLSYQLGIAEHFYFDKPVTGGFNNIKFEPFSSLSFSFVFKK